MIFIIKSVDRKGEIAVRKAKDNQNGHESNAASSASSSPFL
jgi:hypothetical protein